MLKFYLILFLLSILAVTLSAQEEIELGRTVISSAGRTVQTQDIIYSFTVGEPIIGIFTNDAGYITQGFQQPDDKLPIRYTKLVSPETCPDLNDGKAMITDFKGCLLNDYTVTWQDGSVGNSIENLGTGVYYFTVRACDETIQDSVFIGLLNENPCGLSLYTAFSPNDDGVNDTWFIDNITVPPNDQNEVSFFNIWGQEIRSYTNYDNRESVWDGKNNNGVDLATGTYYFVLKLSYTTHSGYIELTR